MRDDRRRPELRPLDQTIPSTFPPPSSCLSTTRHNDLRANPKLEPNQLNHSWIFARISESRNRWYSYTAQPSQLTPHNIQQSNAKENTLTSSPTLIGFPPHPGRRTRSPGFTDVGTTLPSLSGAPGPTAITVASGNGVLVVDDGRKMPVAVFCGVQGVQMSL